MPLSKEQFMLLFKMQGDENMFITGKAGTGKSYLLQRFLESTKKNIVLLAPTGKAALNISGQTIHSFFCLKVEGEYKPEDIIADFERRKDGRWINLRKTLNKVDTIVIDEISMVRVDLFHTLDIMCRTARHSNEFFGGIQVILVGDLYQLPPVVEEEDIKEMFRRLYGDYFFFNAVDVSDNIKVYEMQEVFRQSDQAFKTLLDNIREGKCVQETLNSLNVRVGKPPMDSLSIIISSTNASVDKTNKEELDKLDTEAHTYNGITQGSLQQKDFPTTKNLFLKVGAHVMMLNNDANHRWVNGSLGIVKELYDESAIVEIDGHDYEVLPYTWTVKNHHVVNDKVVSDVAGRFTQLPIKVAYAITAHKSQGQTYDSVYIKDFRGFDFGHTYVALSRCKDINKLYLDKPLRVEDVKVSPSVVEFMNSANS